MDRVGDANDVTIMDSGATDCSNQACAPLHTLSIGSSASPPTTAADDANNVGNGVEGATVSDQLTTLDQLEKLEFSSCGDVESGSAVSMDLSVAPSGGGDEDYLPAGVDPETVRVLEGPGGARVWLLGTVHFSERSQHDVGRLSAHCRPHVLALELCPARAGILHVDERVGGEGGGEVSAARVYQLVQQQGAVAGLLHVLLLQLTARLTARLGVVPGGEFRRAYRDCVVSPVWHGDGGGTPCASHVHLADRPIQITLRRAMAGLGVWQRVRLAYKLITSDTSDISHADLERAKQRDILERMLAELSDDFPSVSRVFIDERDQFMSGSLWHSCVCHPDRIGPEPEGSEGRRVLAVVGIGHLDGIVAHWGRVAPHQYRRLLEVAPPPRSVCVFSASVKVAMLAGLVYAGCRVFTRDPVARGRDLAMWLARTTTRRAHTCFSALMS